MIEAPTISVVVPCHDEEDNIRLLVERITASIEPLDAGFEVISWSMMAAVTGRLPS